MDIDNECGEDVAESIIHSHATWKEFGEEAFLLNEKSSDCDLFYQQTYCRWAVCEPQGQLFYKHAFSERVWPSFCAMYLDFCKSINHTPLSVDGKRMY